MALTLTPALLHMALPRKAKSVLKEEVSKWSKGLHWSSRFIPLLWTQPGLVLFPARKGQMLLSGTVASAWCVVFAPGLFREELQPQEVRADHFCLVWLHLNTHGMVMGTAGSVRAGTVHRTDELREFLIQHCLPELSDTGYSFMFVLSGRSSDK